jgi:GNAT superfamily N-acetyltransferase
VLPEYQGFGIGRKLLDYAAKGATVYNLPIVLMAALGELTSTAHS